MPSNLFGDFLLEIMTVALHFETVDLDGLSHSIRAEWLGPFGKTTIFWLYAFAIHCSVNLTKLNSHGLGFHA